MIIKDLLKISKGYFTNLPNKLNKKINKIRFDSRLIEKNDVFICINSGTDYIDDAIKRGCICIISEKELRTKVCTIKVDNIKSCLLNIGTYLRNRYKYIPLIAIAGSVGKSTTKELISNILSQRYKVLKNEGNKNNYIGVTETLLNLSNEYDVCVLELGMNHEKEIEELSLMVQPDICLITNIGTSHIGNLGSIDNILKAKLEMIKGMTDGYLIVPYLDKKLRKLNYDYILKCYDIELNDISINDTLKCKLKYKEHIYNIVFDVPNRSYLSNILLAFKTCTLFEISETEILKGIPDYKTIENRMEIINISKTKIISDCYNSSYESLIGCLDYLKKDKKNKILILGDIKELGKYSEKIHKKINKEIKKLKNYEVLLVGNYTKYIKGIHFDYNKEIINYLEYRNLDNYTILIKGSRLMKLEDIKDYLISNI